MLGSPATSLSMDDLATEYRRVRQTTENICAPLQIEDYGLQTVPEASPAKWHLAHVTWFYETFVLLPYAPDYRVHHPAYNYLFNSYYQQIGGMHPRAERGLLSRPSVVEVREYRAAVDRAVLDLLSEPTTPANDELLRRLRIGLNHEQQHQELLLTDIKRNLGYNPLRPAYRTDLARAANEFSALQWLEFDGGLIELGNDATGFCYDNELPRHRRWLHPFRLASRLVTNDEYARFVEDDGYRRPEFWLADAWAHLQQTAWKAPLYWEPIEGRWHEYTLGGIRPLAAEQPVCHISYYEAEAYARWCGRRLPGEAEWEHTVGRRPIEGNLYATDQLHPGSAVSGAGLQQMYGDCWEWTASPYTPYPGYRADAGAIGEYNGKFMCNQIVLRGGSCATPDNHLRASYRNFFYPHERWQFMGLRLADDG